MPRNLSGIYSLPAGVIVTDGVDDILASQPNTGFQDLEADMNDARPIVAGGTGADNAGDARTNLDVPATGETASLYATVGGTANALTVTTSVGYTGTIPNGSVITIVPTAANTTAATVNVDATGAASLLTVRLTALPADYLLTGIPVQIVKTASGWVVIRSEDHGTDGTTTWIRYPNGVMIQRAPLSMTGSGDCTWTFAKTFTNGNYSLSFMAADTTEVRSVQYVTTNAGDVVLKGRNPLGTWTGSFRATAVGFWF